MATEPPASSTGRRRVAPRLSRMRVGTRLLLLLLVPMSALVAITGVANWRAVHEVRELRSYQQATKTSARLASVADAVARERAATVRARVAPSPSTERMRAQQQAAVDRVATAVSQAETSSHADVAGSLDAARRQLFSLRLRADALSVPALELGYGQALDVIDSLRRSLGGDPPTRDIATAAIANFAIRSVVEAARREQLDTWILLRSGRDRSAGSASAQWEPLERTGINAFRSWASSAATADLNAALFNPSGLYVREQRQRLRAGTLRATPEDAARWWRRSGERIAALAQVRAVSRTALDDRIAADLSSEQVAVAQRLGISLFAVVVGLALGFLLRRSIARSLAELAEGANALSQGKLDVEIESAGDDEIAAVGSAFQTVRTTNRRLVAEVEAMNRAIAVKQLTRRADPSAFRGAWADLLAGMNDTMDEVSLLHAAEQRELHRQEVFASVGRQVVGGELALHEAYAQCCRLLVEHTSTARAEIYERTAQGWERRAHAGTDGPARPPTHDFHAASRSDAPTSIVRRVGVLGNVDAVLVVDPLGVEALEPGDRLFLDGVVRLLDEAVHHHEAERERFRAQQIETAGTLAATFAHDFNNVLGAILNHAQLGELETTDPGAADTFHAIGGAVNRAAEVVNRLLRFSRDAPPRTQPCDIADLAAEACALVRPGLPRAITLTHHVDGSPDPVLADAGRVHQVIVNLITNAAQALGSSPGHITVTVDQLPADGVAARPATGGDGCVRVRVRDSGPGIPAAILARIFEPFFTTKPEGEGTGLGLASARAIARDHGGTLDLENTPGGGATATLCLPANRSLETAR